MATPAAVLNILVTANTTEANAALARTDAQLKKTAATASGASATMGTKLAKGAKLASAAVVGLAAVGLYKGIKAGAEFEKQMDSLGSVAQASGKQMEKAEKQALALGESTKFTANEVAKAQTELAKGGLTIKQILGGALPAALNLAAAGELDLAQAAETTVNAMKLFGLHAKDAGAVADILATAANKTTADVTDFAMALKQSGSVAKLAGFDLNQTVTVLEALAEAGIKNSDAGTSLKTFFLHIGNPSKKAREAMAELNLELFNQQGAMKSLPAIAKELQSSFGDLSKEEFLAKAGTIAGSDSIRTLWALYDLGPKKIKNLEKANSKQGTAAKIAAEKMDNLSGDFEQLTGALETSGIKLYKVIVPGLRIVTQALTVAVQAVNNFDFAGAIAEVESFVMKLKPVWDLIKSNLPLLKIFGAALLVLISPLALIVINFDRLKGAVEAVADWMSRAGDNIGKFVSSLIPVKILLAFAVPFFQRLWSQIKLLIPVLAAAAKMMRNTFVAAFAAVKVVIPPVLKVIGDVASVVGDVVALVSHLLRGEWKAAWRAAGEIVRDVFHTWLDVIKGGWTIIKGFFRIGVKYIKDTVRDGFVGAVALIKAAWRPIGDFFKAVWDRVTGIFESAWKAIEGFVKLIVGVINALPFVPEINLPGEGSTKSKGGLGKKKGANEYGKHARGGAIRKPMAIVGEEAPRHHEWVIATNPAYRKANVGYWAQAGHDLGVPGFLSGGDLSSVAEGIGKGISSLPMTGGTPNAASASKIIGKLPNAGGLPPIAKPIGTGVVKAAAKYIRDKVSEHNKKLGSITGFGAAGTMPIDGKPVADWIGRILLAARKAGVEFSVSSGWRSYAEQKAIYDSGVRPAAVPGTSHHEGIQYPSGAVDISPGATNLAAWLGHTRWRNALIYAGSKDPVHFSHPFAGGYKAGGLITGKVSYFGGGETAGGSNTSRPGMALNLNPGTESGWQNPTTEKWMEMARAGHPQYGRVTIAGKTANLPITDLGPAAETGRAIDITEGGVRKLGLSTSSFPTDSIGKVFLLGTQGKGAREAKKRKVKGKTGLGTNVPAGAEFIPSGMGKGIEEGISKTGKALTVAGLKSSALLPAASGLPPSFQKMLSAPGLTYEGKLGIAERAMEVAGTTEDRGDDQAVRNFKRELYNEQAAKLRKSLKELEKKIRKGGVKPATMTKYLNKAAEIRGALGDVEGGLTGLESEEKTEAQEAVERQTEATLELAQTQAELAKELRETRELSESAMATGSAVAWRALADKLSGNLGVRVIANSRTAGIGTVGRS